MYIFKEGDYLISKLYPEETYIVISANYHMTGLYKLQSLQTLKKGALLKTSDYIHYHFKLSIKYFKEIMNTRIVKGITYVAVKNNHMHPREVCDGCDLFSGENRCKLDALKEPSCEIHYSKVYKKSLKEQLKKL